MSGFSGFRNPPNPEGAESIPDYPNKTCTYYDMIHEQDVRTDTIYGFILEGLRLGGKYRLVFDWSLTIHLFTTPFCVYDLCHCVVSAEPFDSICPGPS